MSDEQVELSEVSGRASREPVESSPLPANHAAIFLCRWDRPIREGEEVKWHEVEASSVYDAAHLFALSCDGSNPRPPAKRVVVVYETGKEGQEKRIQVTVRAALAYEVIGI